MADKQNILANLYTFSVVAKFLSFTLAAEELCLTQGAVSQRIKKLEADLGFTLFIRLTRKLELTDDGIRMLRTLTKSLSSIFTEIDDIRFNELRGELYIGVAPTFAHLWLVPKLAQFQNLYPHLDVKIRVKASKLDFQNQPVDIAIYYGDEKHPDFYRIRLFDEYLVPVCTPEYAERFGLGESDRRLSEATFLHCTESLEFLSPLTEWQHWLESTNRDTNILKHKYVFNHEELTMVAARISMGIALGRYNTIRSYLDSGELIAPFERVSSGFGYDLICPKGHETRPKLQAFLNWIKQYINEYNAHEDS
ncbi:LysR substrate-binding domain-containing protein [Vibrio ruber]|uniref:Glycine cleavage system transcriptional activator n=1 Tax=Vibrio ruber (strain DSM 16370 / JCM 11486 / BCRC 17186 / CECT 7878 / LMG 23124 / VR1) TaxID=1123498 RepID=A0A1R4L8K0_VIBR1|nr:LysR substrate-binding domain-containing protein [Vibrio ruber]WNJ96718.1 LysR substrate-binding domain-containing protein [Vibrio ruber]SJN52882.1 Glycine cleavage system transcriptional activator [Vibrio ruber DSM 16370]